MHESESESEVAQSCLTPSDTNDCSLPGSSVHGIFQARVLEWGAIAFSAVIVSGVLISNNCLSGVVTLKRPQFVAFANLCDINTSAKADFKLPSHLTWIH